MIKSVVIIGGGTAGWMAASYLKAQFQGKEQFGWFALGASLPLISMDAERAARQIVEAIKRRETERILSLPANAIARLVALFPGTAAEVQGLANRFLPGAERAEAEPARGRSIQGEKGSGLLDAATAWGRAAAERFNQNA